jgi:serine/threonine protein kinase
MDWKGMKVAVKSFELSKNRGSKLKCFKRELKALVACNHPNVLKSLGAGTNNTTAYIVLELGTRHHILNLLSKLR